VAGVVDPGQDGGRAVGADHAQLGGALPAAPVLEEGGIFKEKWWRIWEPAQDPKCDIRLMSVDTAYTDKTVCQKSARAVGLVHAAR
jgi:hypothetical protein